MFFYKEVTVVVEALDGKWKEANRESFGFIAQQVLLSVHTAAATVEVSFTGHALHGEIGGANEPTVLEFENCVANEIYLRSAAGGEKIQVWAWGR